MRPFRVRRQPTQYGSLNHFPRTRSLEACAEEGPSRHDAQMLTARIVPADPYKIWLDQREAERRGGVRSLA